MAFEAGDYYSERQSGGTGVSHDEAVRIANEMSLTQDVPDDVLLKIYEYRCEVTQRDQAGRPTVTEFGLEPTAEWSRITQALKELEDLKNYSSYAECIADTAPIYFAEQEIYVKEVEPLKAERDELAAELERVKAERDELKSNSFSDDLKTMSILAETDQHIKDCKTFLEEFKKLSSLKSRLPVNADGDVPDIGDEQWIWHEHHGPSPTEIHGIRDDGDGWYYVGPDDCGINPLACHSTAESCRAANGGGE